MKWGQLGQFGGVHGRRTRGKGGHGVCLAAWLSWPGTARLTAGCSPSGMTEVSVHPVTVKWPEEIRAALLEGTLTYKAIRHARQPKKCPSWALGMIMETH